MKNYFKTQIFPTPYEAAERLAMDFIRFVENMLVFREYLYIGLSGGNTYIIMYEILSGEFSSSVNWEKIHFFWVDERCVPDTSEDSNFGNAFRTLFSKINIPLKNLHYVHGYEDPVNEAVRYTGEILSFVPCVDLFPCFDLLLLGIGNDGHTASIFPGQASLFETSGICTITEHPETKQKRITLTGKSINNAGSIVFLVFGKNKADIIKSIFSNDPDSNVLPAKQIRPKKGNLSWYLDSEASVYLSI